MNKARSSELKIGIMAKAIGAVLLLIAFSELPPLFVSLYQKDGAAKALFYSLSLTAFVGGGLFYGCRHAEGDLRRRSPLLLVALTWLLATLFGSMPFYLSGAYTTFVDAWFESASGFTTTGASVISQIESLPPGILLWRSITQFLGGMGIIVLSLAILPALGIAGMELYRAEAPGPNADKLSSRAKDTAQALWMIYIAFNLVLAALLMVEGMSVFDAFNHAMTTMSSGGFSTKNSSIGAFENPIIHWTIVFFMFCAGTNFSLHHAFFVKRQFRFWQDREFRFYFAMIALAICSITLILWVREELGFFDALRYSAFNLMSLASSTGFATVDYLYWGDFALVVILILMIIGGSAGSTGGGVKCVRALILLKQGSRELKRVLHPSAVVKLKLGKATVSSDVSSAIFGFFYLYAVIIVCVTLILTATGMDVISAVSAAISAMSNIGPGLGSVGPASNYAQLNDIAKITLAFAMIIGRLEIMSILAIFTREFWRS